MRAALRIAPHEVAAYCQRYNAAADADLSQIGRAARVQGFLTRAQLHEIARWKSRRRAALVGDNDESFVREITEFAFRAKHEQSRIGSLVLLAGVSYPTASVILHFCVDDTYPILDFRAIWSLGVKQPSNFTPEYWVEYTRLCRALAKRHGLRVRQFDMALWQYSREHQVRA
jgi:hypothetical protein